jgi:hypothetical protein
VIPGPCHLTLTAFGFLADHGLSVVPTKEWQDNLSHRLTSLSSGPQYPKASASYASVDSESQYSHTAQKRRLNAQPSNSTNPPDWSDMYTIDPAASGEN